MEELVFGRRYRVTERIGTGGMADVYKAVDETLGRTVAVKVMHARFADDPDFVQRFRHEASAAANLSHPSIVNIYDYGVEDGTYYIVMEYVRGTDLKAVIEQKGALPSIKVAEFGAQVCSALSVAHGYDIIHRDIKPHNIMVQPDGAVKVMDFGIARAGNSTMTQTGSVLGTAQYVSPEQAQGKLGPGERPVLARRRALRGRDRPPALRRRHPRGCGAQAGQRAGHPASCGQPGDRSQPRRRDRQGDDQTEDGRPLPGRVRGRAGPGAPARRAARSGRRHPVAWHALAGGGEGRGRAHGRDRGDAARGRLGE